MADNVETLVIYFTRYKNHITYMSDVNEMKHYIIRY